VAAGLAHAAIGAMKKIRVQSTQDRTMCTLTLGRVVGHFRRHYIVWGSGKRGVAKLQAASCKLQAASCKLQAASCK